MKKTWRENMNSDKKLAEVVPHIRQVRFQQLEFYAFVHFTVNTLRIRNGATATKVPKFSIQIGRAHV